MDPRQKAKDLIAARLSGAKKNASKIDLIQIAQSAVDEVYGVSEARGPETQGSAIVTPHGNIPGTMTHENQGLDTSGHSGIQTIPSGVQHNSPPRAPVPAEGGNIPGTDGTKQIKK